MTWIYVEMWSILLWNDEIFYTNFLLRLLNFIFVQYFLLIFPELIVFIIQILANIYKCSSFRHLQERICSVPAEFLRW